MLSLAVDRRVMYALPGALAGPHIRRRAVAARGGASPAGASRLAEPGLEEPDLEAFGLLRRRSLRSSSTSARVVWSAWSCCWSSKTCWSCAASLKVAVVDREESGGAEAAAMPSTSVSR